MTNAEAMRAIVELLDGTTWSPDTLDGIAAICRQAGHEIRDQDCPIRQRCEEAGWRYYQNSPVLLAWCGEAHGIAHVATVEGRENVSDSVYGNWESCWRLAVKPSSEAERHAIASAQVNWPKE